jgi:hypothetical protein
MCDWLQNFSKNYAPGVSAIVASIALVASIVALLYISREYKNKYRPFPSGNLIARSVGDKGALSVSVLIKNAGDYPIEISVTDISLHVGDEIFPTIDKDWTAFEPKTLIMEYNIGNVNEIGLKNVREARYRSNRVSATFTLKGRSIASSQTSERRYIFDIDVRGDAPVVLIPQSAP